MPVRSRFPDITIPNADLWDFLFEESDRPYRSDKVLFRDINDPGRSYSYSQLRAIAIAFGNALQESFNWKKGDVLCIYSPNDIDYPVMIFGCHWVGGIVTTANPGYTVSELSSQLKDSAAKLVVTQPDLLDTARKAAGDAGLDDDAVILMGSKESDQVNGRHFGTLKGLEPSGEIQPSSRPVSIDPLNDLSFLVYSSGTTGKPKGVMLSHTNVVSNILALSVASKGHLSCGNGSTGSGDRTIGVLPFFHIYGLVATLCAATRFGYEVFVMPQFDLQKFCSIVEEEKITYFHVVPRIISALAKDPIVDRYNLKTVKMIVSAAAPLSPDLIRAAFKKHGIPVTQAFGMSETSPATHHQHWDAWSQSIGSIGPPIPNEEAMIVSLESGLELGPGEEGEIWVRGPNVFKGYLNNPIATASTISDGWVKTGDLGYRDADGLFYITDRVKELIKYNGFQVAPAELEGILTTHPMVLDAAVVGVYDKHLESEVPRAFLVCKDGVEKCESTALDIAAWLGEKVSRHKRLRGGVRFVDAIPYSQSGKILRRQLREITDPERAERSSKL